MLPFRKISIKRKLTLITIATSAATLLLAGVTFLIYDLVTSPRTVAQRLSSLAVVVGSNTAAALAFNSRDVAEEVLAALRATPSIVWAYVYRKDGSVLASYRRDGLLATPPHCPREFEDFRRVGRYVELCRPITLRGEMLGVINLRSDLSEASARRWDYAQFILGAGLLCLLAACVISLGLQRIVSRPILDLAQVARTVSREQNYSIRARSKNRDEIGSLVDGFNELLGQIQKRDAELQQAQAELEKRVAQLQVEVAERQRTEETLTNKNLALQRSNAELEQFAYVASHDLQEPLRMITGYTQLLVKRYQGKLDLNADEYINFAVDGAKRMQGLINDLLTYSRVGTRGKAFALADCEIILRNALASLEVAIQESGATVTHDPLPTVLGDEGQLGQLFQNLISNAIKYRDNKSPEIHVSSKREGKAWLFSVKDNGIGIDPRYAERIFVIFQRLHTRDEYPGTGIGLALCKKIIERHGGSIWVESAPGEGATFYFTIPTTENERKSA